MKRIFTSLLSISALVGLSISMFSWSNNPPNGKTGAPSEGTCADCHSMNGGGFDGMIEISGLPSDIEAALSEDFP